MSALPRVAVSPRQLGERHLLGLRLNRGIHRQRAVPDTLRRVNGDCARITLAEALAQFPQLFLARRAEESMEFATANLRRGAVSEEYGGQELGIDGRGVAERRSTDSNVFGNQSESPLGIKSMSNLTVRLLGERKARRDSKWPARISEINRALGDSYGTPMLGNYRDPTKELLYIVLSARTNEDLYRSAYRELITRFPNLESLAKARRQSVSQCIRRAGLGAKRTAQIIAIAARLVNDLGSNPARRLRKMAAEEAFEYFLSLPGVGPKSALCVMMYSLNFDVFPVDAHIQRIAARLGIVTTGLKHYEAQRIIPRFVPNGISKELHVRLIVHGRTICRPVNPRCERCQLRRQCEFGRRYKSASAKVGK